MAELVNVFEKAVLDMKAEGLNVELKEYGLAPFRKELSDFSLDSNVCWEQLKANMSSQPFEELWSNSFLTQQSAKKNAQSQIESRN